jgi:hypothetical protein
MEPFSHGRSISGTGNDLLPATTPNRAVHSRSSWVLLPTCGFFALMGPSLQLSHEVTRQGDNHFSAEPEEAGAGRGFVPLRALRAGTPGLESLECRLFFLLNIEEFVELGNLKDLVNLRVNVTQDQLALGGVHLLVEGDKLAQRGAGQVFHVAKVEHQLATAQLINQAEELFADDLNVLFVEDLFVGEIDHRDIADVFDFQATATRLRRHRQLLERPAIRLPGCWVRAKV